MTTETTAQNLSALPYKINVTRPEYYVMPVDALHTMMCDLTKKIPNIYFETQGIQRWGDGADKGRGDDYYVYVGTEKVGNIWMSMEYRDGKNTYTYNLSSSRISTGRKGRKSTKKTKHYKNALREALVAFAPFEMQEIAAKIVSCTDSMMTRIAERAKNQLAWALNPAQADFARYVLDVLDNGPRDVPTPLFAKLPNGWRDKLNNHEVADSLLVAYRQDCGIVLKLTDSGDFTAVSLNAKLITMQGSSSYDLPPEYQDKFTILKMMEKDQPVARVGVKTETEGGMAFYLMGGDLLEQETPTT